MSEDEATLKETARLERVKRLGNQRADARQIMDWLNSAHDDDRHGHEEVAELVNDAISLTYGAFEAGPARMWKLWTRRRRDLPTTGLRTGQICRCGHCLNQAPAAFMCYDYNQGHSVCYDCLEDAYSHNWRRRSATYYEPEPESDDDEDNGLCNYDDEDNGLCDYMASPISQLGQDYLAGPGERVTEKTRLFGCEIEFVAKHGLSSVTDIGQNVGIFKHDGSLPDSGAEFCTLPMTRLGVSQLEPVLASMHERGARAWNYSSCGLHVHVSRASASWLAWSKVERFMRNPSNQTLITRVAGREPNDYCRRNSIGPANIPAKAALLKFRGEMVAGRYMDRYDALNFATGGKPTVEFRIFRGNVNYAGVLRAIQFCDSLLEYAATQSNNAPMVAIDYLAYVAGHAKGYPELAQLLLGREASAKDTG